MASEVKPTGEVFYDKYEQKAVDLYRGFEKDKEQIELLNEASAQIALSANPEAKQISTLYKAWYFREKGMKEKDDKKAQVLLLKSLTEFKKIEQVGSIVLKKIELEYLKRKLGSKLQKPDPKIVLRRAILFKELGNTKQYYQDMAMYYMFLITKNSESLHDEDVMKYADQMLKYSKKGLNDELLFKMKAFYHQIKANNSFNPKDRAKELQKAVESIGMTSDKYGKKMTETEALMAKAMSTVDREKRNVLLAKVVKEYQKRGLKERVGFVTSLMSPVPIKAAKIIYLCDASIEKLKELEKKLLKLRTSGKPAAIFYHIGYLIERIKDVKRIMMRMAIARKELTDLEIKAQSLTPSKITSGKPYPERLQKVLRRSEALKEQMRQDMESLFIYGNLLLDQWSYTISYISGNEVPKDSKDAVGKKDLHFAGLLNLLQAKNYKGDLFEFWNKHKKDIIWLNFHLRSYRNIFVEHVRKPWQRGTTMASYGDDFNFHIPAPVGYVNDEERTKLLEEVYKLAPKRLKD